MTTRTLSDSAADIGGHERNLLICYGCRKALDALTVCPVCVKPSHPRCLRVGGCRGCLERPRLSDAVAVLVLGLVLLTGAACHRENNPTAPTAHAITLPPQGRVGTAR